MKNYNLFFTIVIIFFCTSCGEEVLNDDPDKLHIVKQVYVEDELLTEYTYTNTGLISEEKSKFHYTKHTYNSENQLIQSDHYWDERIASSSMDVLNQANQRTEWVSPENTERDSYYTFEYHSSGKLKKRTMHRINNGESFYDTFLYNDEDKIERRTSFHENKESVYDDYFYDERGNLEKQQRYFVSEDGTPTLQTTTEFECDEKNNPFLAFHGLMIPGKNTNPNNIVKEIYTIYPEMDIQTMEYSYEYDFAGYPVKRSDGTNYVYY